MKEARYLIRLGNEARYQPGEIPTLRAALRRLAEPSGGRVRNLRVTPLALEFDLFLEGDDLDPFFRAWAPLGEKLTAKRLDGAPVRREFARVLEEARALFNEERFWEVHEALEDPWRAASGETKAWLQGLILAAAALVHFQKDEAGVGWRMMEDAIGRLEKAPTRCPSWDLAGLRLHYKDALSRRKMTAWKA